MRRRRAAFTLIELVVVLIIVAIFSSLAAMTLGRGTASARLAQATDQIGQLDGRVRRAAIATGSVGRIDFRRRGARLRIETAQTREALSLPRGITIARFRRPLGNAGGSVLRVEMNTRGVSESYAVNLRCDDQQRWVVVLGLSGQVITVNSGDQVDAIFGA